MDMATCIHVHVGTKDVDRLSDKQLHYIHRMGVHTIQSCLYNTSPNSLLYQEMLSFKASQAFSVVAEQELDDDDSDWEILPEGEYYDGGSETSTTSSLGDYSDDDSYAHSPYAFAASSKRSLHYDSGEENDKCLDGRIRIQGDMDLQHSDDEIEVGFHSRRGNTNPPGNGTHSGGPNPSSEDTKPPAGAILRRGQRTVVVHPTIHPQEKVTMTTTTSSNKGIKHHAHPRRRSKKQSKVEELSVVPATKNTTSSASTQRNDGDDIKNHLSSLVNSTQTSASCPKELTLAPQSISVSPQSGMVGYITPPRRIDDEIDVIPPSTSEDDEDNAPRHRQRLPQQSSRMRYSFDAPAPLLHVPPLSGSSSSLEMNLAGTSPIGGKKSPSDNGVRIKAGRDEDTDSVFANRPLGLATTAGLIQTSRLVI